MKNLRLLFVAIICAALFSCSEEEINEIVDDINDSTVVAENPEDIEDAENTEDPDDAKDPEDDAEPISVEDLLKGKLHVPKGEIGIFELAMFYFGDDEDADFPYFYFPPTEISQSFDSITWEVSGFEGSLSVFRRIVYSENVTSSWSQNFFIPGKYTNYLLGYKDGNVVAMDSAYIQVVNKKDFLCFNWNEVPEYEGFSVGYHDNFSDYYFSTISKINDDAPSVQLFYKKDTGRGHEYIKMLEGAKQNLYDQLVELYSNPVYDFEDEESIIDEKYNILFNNKKDGAKPLYIWLTEKSSIVLLEHVEEGLDCKSYSVCAEPRKKDN